MKKIVMLLISLIVLPMYGQEWINFGKMKECTKVPVYFTVNTNEPYYRIYKFEGNTVIYRYIYANKLPEVRVPVVSFSKNGKQAPGIVTVPGTVTVVGTGDKQVITYEFLNIDNSYSSPLTDLFAGNEKPVEFWSPVKVTDPFADSEEYGYTHYFSYTSSLQKRISTKSVGWVNYIEVGNVRIVIKSKPKDAVGLMAYLGAKLGTKGASSKAEGTYKIPVNGKEIRCSAGNKRNNERKDEITNFHYSTEGSPEEIKSVANFLLKSLKCNTAFAPQKKSDCQYEQFIVSDSLEISISIYDNREYMSFGMEVGKKQEQKQEQKQPQTKPKKRPKSPFDIGGLEYNEMSAMRLTEILDSLAVNPKKIEKEEITKTPLSIFYERKPKVIGILEYKYCNYFYLEDWIVIDVLKGTTDIAETEIKDQHTSLANSSRENIDTDLYITQSGKILIKKIGEKTRYYIWESIVDGDNRLPYSKQN